MASFDLHFNTHQHRTYAQQEQLFGSGTDDFDYKVRSHTVLIAHGERIIGGQQPLPTTSEMTTHCCSSRASPAIGHDGPEPLFKGQSLQWLHGSLKRQAGEALQHGDMLDARLDGADDT